MIIHLRQLKEMLNNLARLADSLGSVGHASDLRLLGDVLAEEVAVSSATEAVSQIRSRLAASPPRRRASSAERGRAQPTRPSISVDEYVHRLEGAREDAESSPLLEIFRDRSFKKADLDKIAHRFAKGPEKYPTKAKAIQDIEQRLFQRRRSSNEIDFLNRKKVTPW